MDHEMNEISTQKTGALVEALDQQGIGEMLKPLIREIHLFDSFVAGTTHLEDPSVLEEIRVGDKLSLQREENKFDDNAIVIRTEQMKKLGYVPEKDSIVIARLMDAGKLLNAQVTGIGKKEGFRQISIGICLIDF